MEPGYQCFRFELLISITFERYNATMKYPYLPAGREIEYVPSGNQFMVRAREAARDKSTEHNHPTGSVVVRGMEVIGEGANKAAIVNQSLINFHRKFCVRKILRIKTGEKYWLCPGCASPQNHSEARAIKDAYSRGFDPSGADLYLWGHWWCCEPCWNSIIKAGIANVYLMEGSERLFNKENPENIIGQKIA
jgi:deoxycytidylate deaminase